MNPIVLHNGAERKVTFGFTFANLRGAQCLRMLQKWQKILFGTKPPYTIPFWKGYTSGMMNK